MINRISDVIVMQELVDELRMLGALPEPWLRIEMSEDENDPFFISRLTCSLPPLIGRVRRTAGSNGTDLAGLFSLSQWVQCPRLVRPTAEQAESLSHVEVNIEVTDYAQPFPTMLVETPGCGPFIGVLCHHWTPRIIILSCFSRGNRDDIVCCVRHVRGRAIERSLEVLYGDIEHLLDHSKAAQRVALNMLLSLMHFGHVESPLLPKDYAMDRMYAKEDSERGHKARRRVGEHLTKVDFPHQVIIRRGSPRREEYNKTDRKVKPHWVRGHWKMQWYPSEQSHKRLLIRPYMTGAEEVTPARGTVYLDRRG